MTAPAKTHSTLGPSAASRWSNCPGSIRLSENLPKPPSNKYSAEGTVAHELAEAAANGATRESLMKRVGDTVMEDGFEIEITEEMVDGAMEYRDLIAKDAQEIKAAGKQLPIVGAAERRVTATSVDDEVKGTADYLLYQKGHRLVVYDYKYGKRAVQAFENPQMGLYALGVMDSDAGYAYDEVEMVIFQPRAGGARRWAAPMSWLLEFQKRMREAAALTRTPDAPIVAGPWCRYCPAAVAGCPVANKAVQDEVRADFEGVAPVMVKGALPDVAMLPVDQLVRALEWEEFVNGYFEAIRDRIHAMLGRGESVPGLKLVAGKSNRQWKEESAVVAEFAPLLGEDALYERKLLSPAKLEKVVGKKKVDHLTYKPEGKPQIVRADDPREPLMTNAQVAAAFDAVPADPLAEDPLGLPAPEPKKREPLWP